MSTDGWFTANMLGIQLCSNPAVLQLSHGSIVASVYAGNISEVERLFPSSHINNID